MANSNNEGVRIGPSSLVTLIAALLLAVLAMLCATSANAQYTMSQRQADATQQTYTVDACGQRFYAAVASAVADGATSTNALDAKLSGIASDTLAQSESGLSIDAHAANSKVNFTVTAEDGRTLNGTINLNGTSMSIAEWKLSTTQTATEDTLWTANGDQ